MKRNRVLISLLTLMALVAALGASAAGKANPIRVMSYNVRHLEGIDNVIDPARTAAVINSVVPDVVFIQEVDSATHRSGGADQMAQLGALTGMRPLFGRAIDFEGGGYGIGMLTRKVPLAVRRIPLPGEEPRLLLIAEFDNCVMACTHLALEREARMESVRIIEQVAAAYAGKPFIIGGDWNAEPSSDVVQAVRKDFFIISPQAPTFPADKPVECLDYIAVDRQNVPATCCGRILGGEASDHRAISVTISF